MLGVDVGNTGCTVAVMRQGTLQTIANEQGHRSTPAVVAFSEVETLIGEPATGQMARNARNSVVDLLFMLGRRFDDEVLQTALPRYRFALSAADDGSVVAEVTVKGEGRKMPIGRLLSVLIGDVRGAADAFCGGQVKEVVLAVPVHFDEGRRAALLEAARNGGARVKHMISAPLAVALLHSHTAATSFSRASSTDDFSEAEAEAAKPSEAGAAAILLVVDVGGTTTSASVLQRRPPADHEGPGEAEEYSVISTATDERFGGTEVDLRLRQHVLKDIQRRGRIDLSDNGRVMARLLAACESCKRSLATGTQATLAVEADGADYFCNVTRAALDAASLPLCTRVVEMAQHVIAQARLEVSDVNATLLSGGATRTLCLQSALAAALPNSPLHFAGIAEEAVARGAALYGTLIAGAETPAGAMQTALLKRRPLLPYPLALGLGDGSTHVLAPARSPLPLACTAALALPAVEGEALVLTLVELAAERGGEGGTRRIAQLVLREMPLESEAVDLELRVSEAGGLTLSCRARFPAESDMAPVTVGSLELEPPMPPPASS